MIQVKNVAFTCYPVTEMARSRAFYEGILGLTPAHIVDRPDAQWVEYEIGPATLTLGMAPGWTPSSEGGNVALEVADFDAAVAHLRAQAVPFTIEPMETPVCHMAIIADPDGSRVVIHRRKSISDPAAITN